MRTQQIRLILAAAAAALFTSLSAQELAVELQRAIQQETVTGNLKAAIDEYKKIAAHAGNDRAIAAKALVHMAECYQKEGDAEARKIYGRVMREYADQKEEAAVARARLSGSRHALPSMGDRLAWSGPKVDGFGSISPDGRFLTYTDWPDTGGLVLHDLVAGTDRRLTAGTYADGQTQFSVISKDGSQVAYDWLEGRQGNYGLRIASLQGTGVPPSRLLFHNDDIVTIAPYDWSPDGKWIAVNLRRQDRTGQIGLVSVRDGALRVLKTVDWKGPTKIFFSPDSRYIAYDLSVGDSTSERDIFVMAVDGSREVDAVAHPSRNVIMGWSPDGDHLLFASDRSGSTDLWTLAVADGKPQGAPVLVKADIGSSWSLGLTASGTMYVWKNASPSYVQVAPVDLAAGRLLPGPAGTLQRFIGSRGRPDWSADGKYLSYASCAPLGGGPCTLYIRSMEGGQVRELRPRLSYFFPRWSPDGGSFITSGTDLNGRHGLYRIDARNGEVSLITADRRGGAQWAADGKSIYYALPSERTLVIEKRDLATGEEQQVLRTDVRNVNPFGFSVSPDGRYVAALSTPPGHQTSTLFVIPIAGGGARPLLRVNSPETLYGAEAMDPAWTPDSRAMLVMKAEIPETEHKELWLVPVDGGKGRKLDIDVSQWVVPGGGFRLAPDGRHIAFVGAAGKKGQEIWALENFLPALKAAR